MADPCKTQRDNVTALAQKLDALENIDGIAPSKILQAKAQVAAAQTQLAACEQAHADAYVATTGPEYTDPSLAVFDHAMQQFMVANTVHAGQLCILNKGFPLLQRGYAYPTTAASVKPTSLFRIASISKMFTSAAIKTLVDHGILKLSQPAFALLGITKAALATQTPDPRVSTITVQNLLDHTGGWNDGTADPKLNVPSSNFDAVFQIRKIANDLGLSGPPTKRDLARYMYGMPLQFAPGGNNGAISAYSNFGYTLLGLIVEEVSGMPYIDFVRDELCKPLGIHEVYLGRMLAGAFHPREVAYDAAGSGPNALEPHANVSAPTAYGGGGFVTELMDSGGGLVATATALAFFAHSHAAYGYGGRMGSARSGGMAGTMSLVETRGDIDFAYIFNTAPPKQVVDGFYTQMNALFDKTPLPVPQIRLPVQA
jgi:CubicO group peptidase (beta-lactamase class C family)